MTRPQSNEMVRLEATPARYSISRIIAWSCSANSEKWLVLDAYAEVASVGPRSAARNQRTPAGRRRSVRRSRPAAPRPTAHGYAHRGRHEHDRIRVRLKCDAAQRQVKHRANRDAGQQSQKARERLSRQPGKVSHRPAPLIACEYSIAQGNNETSIASSRQYIFDVVPSLLAIGAAGGHHLAPEGLRGAVRQTVDEPNRRQAGSVELAPPVLHAPPQNSRLDRRIPKFRGLVVEH
jgi:hypothetical protein